MKIGNGTIAHGIVRENEVHLVEGDLFGLRRETGAVVALAEVTLLAPVEPTNVLCIGRNYKSHAQESGGDVPEFPLLFLKATSSITGPDEPIVIPRVAPAMVDYEAELVAVIGRTARNVAESEALQYVLGYTCGNDVTARDCQKSDGQWARAKSFDTFGPIGPWIETDLDPAATRLRGRLNGDTVQDSPTSLLAFGVPHLISYFSRGMTLTPGTIIFTGTPAGIGLARTPQVFMRPGDTFEVEIDGIGVLSNDFVDEAT